MHPIHLGSKISAGPGFVPNLIALMGGLSLMLEDEQAMSFYGGMNRKGYLPHAVVKAVVFWTLVFCVLTATSAGILHSWDLLGSEGTARWVTTTVILACGSMTFLFINCLFGELGSGLFAQASPPPQIDPAFGERLRQAKLESKEQRDSIAG